MDDHAAGTLQERFDDDGGDLQAALLQLVFELIHTFDATSFALKSNRTTTAVGGVHTVDGIPHGVEGLGEG
jgi:hypothetical protein